MQIERYVAKQDLIKVCSEELVIALRGRRATPKHLANFCAVVGELARVYHGFAGDCIKQLRTSSVCMHDYARASYITKPGSVVRKIYF